MQTIAINLTDAQAMRLKGAAKLMRTYDPEAPDATLDDVKAILLSRLNELVAQADRMTASGPSAPLDLSGA